MTTTLSAAPYRGWLQCIGLLVLALACSVCSGQTILYEKASPYNTIIVTEGSDGLRTLLFEKGGARQSVVKPGDPDHLELPYARSALAGLSLCDGPRRVLVVGLGGGTLPMFLRKYYPEAHIDVAELDPDVVTVAMRFFGFVQDERMQAHVGDGRRYIENLPGPRYDAIFLDAFGTDSVPVSLTTREFLGAVRRALMPGGVVIGNVWRRAANRLYDSMLRTYQAVFEDLYLLEVPGAVNEIFLATAQPRSLTREDLARTAGIASTAARLPFDTGDVVRRGYRDLPPVDQTVPVLTDAYFERR
jgi:spermidine synthase